jgi:WXXGXW repeat (2 copies)
MTRLLKGWILVMLVVVTLAVPSASQAQVAIGVSIRIGPPVLPVYPQPICPAPGYIWAPGYWAYGPVGYYWVPGTWVMAPAVGLLWTPGYWGWSGGYYAWHAGYWGPHVGFYGGINYGFGYGGVGFVGGAWHGGVFAYNTAVTNLNTTVIHNTYNNTTVINKTTVVNNVSYNGGPGGSVARPNAEELAAERDHHVAATSLQAQHEQAASQNHALLASVNHGRPEIAATSRPGEFTHGVTAAHAPGVDGNRSPNGSEGNAHAATVHSDRPPNVGQGNHGTSTNYNNNNGHPTNTNTNASHPNNNHSNNAHPENAHPENHPTNSHPSGGHPDRPGR